MLSAITAQWSRKSASFYAGNFSLISKYLRFRMQFPVLLCTQAYIAKTVLKIMLMLGILVGPASKTTHFNWIFCFQKLTVQWISMAATLRMQILHATYAYYYKFYHTYCKPPKLKPWLFILIEVISNINYCSLVLYLSRNHLRDSNSWRSLHVWFDLRMLSPKMLGNQKYIENLLTSFLLTVTAGKRYICYKKLYQLFLNKYANLGEKDQSRQEN